MTKGLFKKFVFALLLIMSFSILSTSLAYAFEKTETGLVYIEGLPEYTDEEFLNTPVRMEIFVTDWCKYCQYLKDGMIPAIYEEFTEEQVAIRFLDKDNPKVESYMKDYQEKFYMEKEDEDRKGRIPTTIINGEFMAVGYGGEEMDAAMIQSIHELLDGQDIITMKTYTLKEEFRGKTSDILYRYDDIDTEDVDTEEEGIAYTEEPMGEESEEGKTNYPGEEDTNYQPSFADDMMFFAVQGMYDSIAHPIFAYILAIFLFFVAYKKAKIMLFTGFYTFGLILANVLARYSNTGMALYRQPILLVVCLLFAALSLSIFWDLYFKAMAKTKNGVKLKRSKVLVGLEKILNKPWIYFFGFLFAFAVYFFTTPYDVDYGLVLHYYDIPVYTKIIWLVVNGICVSLLSILAGYVVRTSKKMYQELIEPRGKFGYLYFAAVFYLLLFVLFILYIFRMY